jgi:TonB family protein
MKSSAPLAICFILGIGSVAVSQSGRKPTVVTSPPPVEEPTPVPQTKPSAPPPVTAERNEEYSCTDDGTLARVIEQRDSGEQVFTSKTVDIKAHISSRPRPAYTREARRAGIQGYVTVKAILRSNGEVGTIRVVRGLPGGLTENAIRAACKIKFKPAIKGGKEVTQIVQIEYVFRLADSSILAP